jgi:hypothetical protein
MTRNRHQRPIAICLMTMGLSHNFGEVWHLKPTGGCTVSFD